jgi:hypothetical protein
MIRQLNLPQQYWLFFTREGGGADSPISKTRTGFNLSILSYLYYGCIKEFFFTTGNKMDLGEIGWDVAWLKIWIIEGLL